MKRVLCLLILFMTVMGVMAQRGQDFASRFMQQCSADTVECITISPKMMGQLVAMGGENRNDTLLHAIAKLRSARILQAKQNGAHYYERAEALLKKNARRFKHLKDFRTERLEGVFYSREQRSGRKVEMVMLGKAPEKNGFVLINLTGDIDEEFIEMLMQMFGQHASNT